MKRMVIVAVVAAIVVAAIALYARNRPRTVPGAIRVSGNIEVTAVEVSFKAAGRVVERAVDEGDLARRGQLVAKLDLSEITKIVAQREAEARTAEAALLELLNGSRPQEIEQAAATADRLEKRLAELTNGSRPQEIAEAEAAVAEARADINRWTLDFDRQAELFARDIVSSREFDAVKSSYEMSHARLRQAQERLSLAKEGPRIEQIQQARAELAEARQRLSLVLEGPRLEEIAQARSRLDGARQMLAAELIRLGDHTVASPLDGVVLSKNIEPGEYVIAGTPVVTVGDMVNVWLRAYVNETDLGRVKAGQKAIVVTDSYPGKTYEGHVSFIASQAEFTPKNVQTQTERVKLVYRIKIDILNPKMELKAGMPADADILTQAGAPAQGASNARRDSQ